ncbi:Amyloid-beta-like protein isoform 1 [Schistosoma japonicum]|uniref:Amyloid-beta-like protein isoform 1 n=2 Tax=Schistosoma japonicum TaxID=6182 RepID=A0A4Z2CYF6_SCHJA|nr:Amyloid-beta-like protein isoform 1 [Schistosoma japonicum]
MSLTAFGLLSFFNCILTCQSLYSVAFECGKPAIYLNNEFWVADITQDCLDDEVSILNYCKKVYSGRNITTVVSAPPIDVVLSDWCEFGNSLGKCQSMGNERHEIKPFICLDNIPMSTLFIPVGCQLNNFDSDRNYVCENYKFWEKSAREVCRRQSMRFQSYLPSKPCIKQEDFSSIYFTAAKVVCCTVPDFRSTDSFVSIKSHKNVKYKNVSVSHEVSNSSDKLNPLESSIWDNNEILTNYMLIADQNSSGFSIPERQRYNQAKLELSNGLHKHEKILKQELSDAESLISADDWQNEPVKSQIKEDSLIKEFLTKYVALENKSEQDRKSIETVHHQRIEAQMLERRNAILNAWEKAVNIKNPNNFTLFEILKHLIKVIEHDRNYYIKRFEHLRNVDQTEAVKHSTSIKHKLVELDILLNKSLEKVNMHPKLMPHLTAYANYLRNNKYTKLEAQSKAVLVADVTFPDIVKLPTFQEQAALKAENVIAKYRHHLETLSVDKLKNNELNKSLIKLPRRQKLLTDNYFDYNRKGLSNSHQIKSTLTIPIVHDSVSGKSVLSTVDYSSSPLSNSGANTHHIDSNETSKNMKTMPFESRYNISIMKVCTVCCS